MWSKVRNIVRRAYVTLTNDDSKQFSTAQVNAMSKTMNVETVYPYGLYAQAPLNSLMLLFSIQTNEENLSGIPYSGDMRFKNLKEGEVLLGNVLTKTYIKLDKDGNIDIESTNNITVNAQQVTINAPLTVSGDNISNLGEGAAAKPIARLGDEVTIVIAGNTYIGTITSAGQNTSI